MNKSVILKNQPDVMGRSEFGRVVIVGWDGKRGRMMDQGEVDDAAYSCCSAGIGRWCWLVWASEEDARAQARPLATGFEKNAEAAEKKAVETAGEGAKRLPGKWASAYKRRGPAAAGEGAEPRVRPKSRLSRPVGGPAQGKRPEPLAFLFVVSESEAPDARGEVVVAKHRIVKQTARKIQVDREPFREEGWPPREGEESPQPRTLAVDRETLRREGRFPHRGAYFYATEEAGCRDVYAALTARHPWCETLGLDFPCSAESIKAAFRRLVRETHPDVGGNPAAFRLVEQAYREALAYFAPPPASPGDIDG